MHTCQLYQWFSRESSIISSDVRVSRLEHQICREIPSLINFIIFEILKRKIKQEVDVVLLFEMFSIGKHIPEESNWYIFSEYRNFS